MQLNVFLCVFFYESAHHRDLHSFPTRRSSDLSAPLRRDRGTRRHRKGDGCVRTQQGGVQDRKSTRLNSSHQIISYAVFCLKKKKATPQESFIGRLMSSTPFAPRDDGATAGNCV